MKPNHFLLLLALEVANGAILFWGPKQIQIPALKRFDDDDLKNLLSTFDDPQIIAFTSKSPNAASTINRLLINQATAYVPSAKVNIDPDDIQAALTGNQSVDLSIIQDALLKAKQAENNTMVALIIKDDMGRVKRKAEDLVPTEDPVELEEEAPPSGPVLYSATLPANTNFEAMIYSSKPLLLKTNASNTIYLGNATIEGTVDIRDTYVRLIAKIFNENSKVTLRFKFPWVNGYWYLTSVEVEFINDEHAKKYNLTLSNQSVVVMAARRFSYHCGGYIVFTDVENDMELYLYEVQAQPDAYRHRFDDAYNCVPFMTGPLWSGLLVTFILAIGLIIGLSALGSIKTMDKFDNQKTKQLSITVWE